MIRIGKGRIPERHDGIADEFINRAIVAEDRVRQRREQVDAESRQVLCVHALGMLSKAPHVGKEQRQRPVLAAKFQRCRVGGELLDLRGDI